MNNSVFAKRLALIVFLTTTSAYADSFKYNEKDALWTQTPVLLCRGHMAFTCVEKYCWEQKSEALWEVDFSKNLISFKSIDYEDKILSKAFKHFSTSSRNSIFLSSGRVMQFYFSQSKVEPAADNILAVVVEVIGGGGSPGPLFDNLNVDDLRNPPSTKTTHLECVPE